MQFSKITTSSTDLKAKESSWAKQIVSWLGRLCSFCSSSLMMLVNKVTLTTFTFFNQQTPPPSSVATFPPPPLTPTKSFKNEENQIEIEDSNKPQSNLSLPELFEDEETVQVNIEVEPQAQEKIREDDEPLQVKKEPSSTLTKFKRFKKKGDLRTTIGTVAAIPLSIKTSSPATENVNKETLTPSLDSLPPGANSVPIQTIARELKPIYYDNKGGGNCQMLAILKGLEMQYPERLKALRKSLDDDLTAQQLRQMGVDFARSQIDSCGKYAESVLSYADTDRKEFNRVYIDPVMKKKDEDLEKIEENFKARKITKNVYNRQIKEYKAKHAAKIVNLKKDYLIYSDELFLNSLEKNGFYCSTLHLFALSVLLEIPIYVKEQYGVKNHDIQMFNPTESQAEPIHLYRVANRHYQYIYYAKD